EYEMSPRRPGDIDISIANPLKAKQILGWEATRSIFQSIEDGRKFVNNQDIPVVTLDNKPHSKPKQTSKSKPKK
ncbi:MAG: hypothetical protein WAZ12_01585, partial [Candidatus Absconditicoccaceae bacterium]